MIPIKIAIRISPHFSHANCIKLPCWNHFTGVLIHINPPLESLYVAEVDVLSLDNGEASLAAGAPHPEAWHHVSHVSSQSKEV
jgi:hypothetical protein